MKSTHGITLLLMLTSSALAAAPQASRPSAATTATTDASPSFDCTKASSRFERLVCSDSALAALDRQLSDTYGRALARSPHADELRAEQRGWIRGRDDCWRADDAQACVREPYIVRIVELRIQNGLVIVPRAVEYQCDDNSKPFTATFYNDEPRAAVITWGNDQAVVPIARSGSGARYAAHGIEFWEHQGVAKVDFFGNPLTCTPIP